MRTSEHHVVGVMSTSEQEVVDVLNQHAKAYADRNAEGILAPFTVDAVRYTLAPPLQQVAGTMVGDVDGVRQWLTGFRGPVQVEHRDPVITVDGDVAFVSALSSMSATTAAGDPFSFWFRSTYGLRRVDGAWRFVHEHTSIPFHMDGTFLAATDLEP